MGLDINATKCFLYAKYCHVDFSKTMMIGRQSIHRKTRIFHKQSKLFGFEFSKDDIKQILLGSDGYSESFFTHLGAKEVFSIDYSDYEEATHIHDMNEPVSDNLKGRFTAVVDTGSLEHIYNFPMAIRNCMDMVKKGGFFIAITPINNWMGHGFYQFSPELFYRIFSEDNGFKIWDMIVHEDRHRSKWYQVMDPDEIKSRVVLISKKPVSLFVIAQKRSDKVKFNEYPLQSDYIKTWRKRSIKQGKPEFKFHPRFFLNFIKHSLSTEQKRWIRKIQFRLVHLFFTFNPKYFKRKKIKKYFLK
jgi:hypothetical protein